MGMKPAAVPSFRSCRVTLRSLQLTLYDSFQCCVSRRWKNKDIEQMDRRNSAESYPLSCVSSASSAWFVLAFLFSGQVNASDDYSQIIEPFLKKHCIGCHGVKDPSGDFSLARVSSDFQAKSSSDHWLRILDQLVFRNMPPKTNSSPRLLRLQRLPSGSTRGYRRPAKAMFTARSFLRRNMVTG